MRILQWSCAALFLGVTPTFAEPENLLKNASFEDPKIEGRIDQRKGGSPSRLQDGTTWGHFQSMERTGALSVGLTSELARTGRQSIYVDFVNAGKTPSAFLMTELLPIKEYETYRISIWGRMDRKRALTLVNSRPLLRLEVEFYEADLQTQAGDTEYRTQQIPGSPRRILFQADKWNEYFAEVKSPEKAAFMKVTFRWETTGIDGVANGMIFFDDAVVTGPAGTPAPPEGEAAVKDPSAPAQPASPEQK